jgi:RNA methyltransferase, TrmH family
MTTGPPDAHLTALVVDGNNVIGSTPDGWWRDRPRAVRRLLARIQCYRGRSGVPIVLVLDVRQRDLPEGDHGGVEVRYASRGGRDAADDRIVELLDEHGGGPVDVVTSDRGLAARATQRRARVVGARAFLARLDAAGC